MSLIIISNLFGKYVVFMGSYWTQIQFQSRVLFNLNKKKVKTKTETYTNYSIKLCLEQFILKQTTIRVTTGFLVNFLTVFKSTRFWIYF